LLHISPKIHLTPSPRRHKLLAPLSSLL
jgi:hypothetical protein